MYGCPGSESNGIEALLRKALYVGGTTVEFELGCEMGDRPIDEIGREGTLAFPKLILAKGEETTRPCNEHDVIDDEVEGLAPDSRRRPTRRALGVIFTGEEDMANG